LVPRPNDKNVIGTKWIFKKKLNENGDVIRNKARLVCKGYTQQEVIDFKETFAPVARLDAIRMFLALSSFQEFKVYQMDVKDAFLNGDLEEKCTLSNQMDSSLGMIQKLYADSKRLSMALNRLHGLGIIVWISTSNNRVFQKDQ